MNFIRSFSVSNLFNIKSYPMTPEMILTKRRSGHLKILAEFINKPTFKLDHIKLSLSPMGESTIYPAKYNNIIFALGVPDVYPELMVLMAENKDAVPTILNAMNLSEKDIIYSTLIKLD